MLGMTRMNTKVLSLTVCALTAALAGCGTTCGPGTVKTDGEGWDFQVGGVEGSVKSPGKVCVPISPVSDCTDFQMVEADGGGHRVDRDGGGHRVDRDGGGGRKERDEPHHPADAGSALAKISYVPSATCKVGVEAPDTTMPFMLRVPIDEMEMPNQADMAL